MLDLIEEVLSKENFTFVRLDGTQQQSEREHVLREFKKDGVDIMLISLRAGKNFYSYKNIDLLSNIKFILYRMNLTGGVGLNLTVANRAFLMVRN